MRNTLFLLSFALIGCQKADDQQPNANAAVAPAPNPNPGAGGAPAEPQQPAPAGAQKQDATGAAELLAAVAKLGGYENTFNKKPGEPVHVMFRSPGLKDDDLAQLRPVLLKSGVPVHLNLNGSEAVTDAGLAHLKDVANIRRFATDSKKITDAGLQNLAGLTQLDELYLANDAITDAGLKHLAKLTNLRKLSVYSKAVTDAGFAHLAGLTNLEEIHVGGTDLGDGRLAHMTGMTKLKDLSVGGAKLTDAGLATVGKLTGLRSLRIEGQNTTPAGAAHLAPLTKLEKLTVLSAPGFTGEALAALAGMTELRELELIYTPALDKAGSAHVGKHKGLKKLRVGRVAEGGLEGIAGLSGLERLDLNYSAVGDADLKHLSGLTGLQSLDVQHTRVTDAGLAHLAGLPNLRDLSAGGNAITDAGLAHLAKLPGLQSLGLTECKVTGSGLKDLTKLTQLKTLWLNGNPVTDAGLPALKDIRSLKEVALTGTKVSDEAAVALKQARPDLRVRDSAGDDVAVGRKAAAPKRPAVEDVSKVEPAFKLTAEAFHKEYEAGRNAAAEKYKGKVIELSGEVDTVGRNGTDAYVTLKVEKQIIGVTCVTADEQPWAKVVRGQKVKVKGKWPEFSVGAALVACVFVETGKYEAIPVTAAELAKEYAADSEATVKKYDKKFLVVAGEVESKEFNSAGAASLVLKTDGKVKVTCSFTAFEKDVTKAIKVGQKVKLVGEFTLNFGGRDEVGVYFCLPLATKP